ncbi:uncharacterized protein ARMOST_04287 [Armillaria ostoyae]|uniref:Uncharacterized protein n=1 Tax=Armillaria ostoyae TaxID=47428 RepID=A0A284QWX2_ARMOS|nr:uncharacterized protein ARMOST_04287 [Armillaria ostoyae]
MAAARRELYVCFSHLETILMCLASTSMNIDLESDSDDVPCDVPGMSDSTTTGGSKIWIQYLATRMS